MYSGKNKGGLSWNYTNDLVVPTRCYRCGKKGLVAKLVRSCGYRGAVVATNVPEGVLGTFTDGVIRW